ncbi:hypothetical protein PWY87_19185 [Kribbella solani]|uniref:hypothetical protein n=1 Tax=Kribbella solani TaxID=236067 RepID=UPI0029BA8D2C|nr:hypothetical protein [Kribbella solani]MDX2974686.1 hypothetical protein [Kribbella solani]MDX3003821.1 hypothetical protein [Kribbella solani]
MQYVPFSVIKSIHEQTHSAMPGAPVRPHRAKRHPVRAVRRWFRRGTPVVTPAEPIARPTVRPAESLVRPVELTLVTAPAEELCEAEVRDRGTTPASVARAC